MKSLLLITCLFMTTVATSVEAATYYVSPNGKDSNSGTSTSYPWQTIAKVNSKLFAPGDIILFEGGKTFLGGIYFGTSTVGTLAKVRGTADKPITISSYGTGQAIISSGIKHGMLGYNTSGFKIQNLIFQGPGHTQTSRSGIEFYTDVPNTLLTSVIINNVEVYGYRNAGITFGSWDELTAGYGNVTISNSKVHDNGDVGITTYTQARLVHKNFILRNNKVYNNPGQADKTWTHSGSGIVLVDVDGATVEYNEAYNNGWLNASTSNGPSGIWGYRCNNLIIQYNESHHNKTGTSKDGGGFDLDGGTTNSIMQYNYSHDNQGAGFLLAQYSGAPTMKNLIVRYNVSENDGRKNEYGGIHLWSSGSNGGIQYANIYNNTVYMTPTSTGTPKAVVIRGGGMKGIRIRNNIFQTTGGLTVVRNGTTADIRFEGNDYWSSGSAFKILWGSTTYTSLSGWRSATGQEKINGVASGYSLNPDLVDPGKGVTIGDPRLLSNLGGYKLKSTSALIDKGLNLTALFGLNVGKRDFFGGNITQLSKFSLGAHQFYAPTATTTVASIREIEPVQVQASPNPVREFTTVRFSLEREESFSLEVYDIRGSKVHQISEGRAEAGRVYEYDLDGRNLAEGLYIVRLTAGSQVQSLKVLVQR
jgi:hypothetical protein